MSVHVVQCHIPEDLNSVSGRHFCCASCSQWSETRRCYQCCTTFL